MTRENTLKSKHIVSIEKQNTNRSGINNLGTTGNNVAGLVFYT